MKQKPKVTLRSHIPITIEIEDGLELALGVKRLNIEEAIRLRARYKEAENAEEGEKKDEVWGSLLLDSFRRYLRLECEVVMECSDGDVEIKKAEELLDFLGGKPAELTLIFLQILGQNSLSALQKKRLVWLTASTPSSDAPERAQPGTTPETTATSAGNGDSAASADAPAPLETPPSGSTDGETTDPPSSSTSAPFAA